MRLVVCLLLLFSRAALSEPSEVDIALSQLTAVKADLGLIQQTGLHQTDEGTVLILGQATDRVFVAVKKHGLGSMATFNEYYGLLVHFRCSAQFFEFIRTPHTEAPIRHLLSTIDVIKAKLQIEEVPFSLLKGTLTQMVEAFEGLRKLDEVKPELRQQLVALRPLMGEAISLASLGDRPKAFAAAKSVYFPVKKLYRQLELISSSAGYRFVLEVMGLNEFIKEYAQIDNR